eukprot:TRINITY_DN3592_c0_g2_i1.p1 TRINITY_DN3592_c0_g2~~TRINITY_DN3592_c0_g2_i1.p1  ORF type:complete len:113 (-),score=1.18 TRINITY_DN3592_c0_g2_i1:1122-1460(-)
MFSTTRLSFSKQSSKDRDSCLDLRILNTTQNSHTCLEYITATCFIYTQQLAATMPKHNEGDAVAWPVACTHKQTCTSLHVVPCMSWHLMTGAYVLKPQFCSLSIALLGLTES